MLVTFVHYYFGHPMGGGWGAEVRGQRSEGTGRSVIGDGRSEMGGALTSFGECRPARKGITAKDTKSAKDAEESPGGGASRVEYGLLCCNGF